MSIDPQFYATTVSVSTDDAMVIRPAVAADGASALRYAHAMFAEAAWWVGTEPEDFTVTEAQERALFRDCRWSDGQQFWLAWVEDQVVGMCSVGVSTRRKTRHVGCLGMSVAAKHRGHGLGRSMLAVCLAYSRALPSLLKIELCVFPDNQPALKLYQEAGFVQEGRQACGSRRADGSFVDNVFMGLWVGGTEHG